MPLHELGVAAAAASAGLSLWQGIGLFGGIPLTVCAAVTAAVYAPHWLRRRPTRREDIRRSHPEMLTKPVLGRPGDTPRPPRPNT
jgi:hypothetical protein